jgi:aminopeptidase YwaD
VTNTTVTKIVVPIETELETLDSEFESVKVYPNPTKDLLNVRVNELITGSQFELLEISGQSILKQSIKNNQTLLDISDLKSGTYLYRFTTNDGVKFGKVVKQ